jgi:hypothetical protein
MTEYFVGDTVRVALPRGYSKRGVLGISVLYTTSPEARFEGAVGTVTQVNPVGLYSTPQYLVDFRNHDNGRIGIPWQANWFREEWIGMVERAKSAPPPESLGQRAGAVDSASPVDKGSAPSGVNRTPGLEEQERARTGGPSAIVDAAPIQAVGSDTAPAAEPPARATPPSATPSLTLNSEDERFVDDPNLAQIVETIEIDEIDSRQEIGGDRVGPGAGLLGAMPSEPVPVTTGDFSVTASGDGWIRVAETHDCPGEFPLKGNAKSKIYHRPTDDSYGVTIPEICFASDDAAVGLGYRPRGIRAGSAQNKGLDSQH